MAVIERYHVIAAYFPVSATVNPNVIAGQFIQLNSSGNSVLAAGASNTLAIGMSADNTIPAGTAGTVGLNTPYQADLTINEQGTQVYTANRVSDPNHNETAASSKMTVYISGGEFDTDQFETTNSGSPIVYTPGTNLYVSANGRLTNVASANTQVVGVCVLAPYSYPSGVPGTDTTDGSISLGTYIRFILKL